MEQNKINTTKLKRSEITPPSVHFTKAAEGQLSLILKNDFTLSGKYFRVLISGKKCDGFLFSVGFTNMEADDFLVTAETEEDLQLVIDPFTAFYLHETTIDYQHDIENDQEGFIVSDIMKDKFQGKFWREDEGLVPPVRQ